MTLTCSFENTNHMNSLPNHYKANKNWRDRILRHSTSFSTKCLRLKKFSITSRISLASLKKNLTPTNERFFLMSSLLHRTEFSQN